MLIYNGGDMLSVATQAQKAKENAQLRAMGFEVWSPQEDKEINDKQNQTQESNDHLAELIFEHDTIGMEEADIIIFEVANTNVGTCVEIGQMAQDALLSEITAGRKPKVYFHSYDIRRTNIPETGDRRSTSINQYLYGAILTLNPKGIQPWDEIVEELKRWL